MDMDFSPEDIAFRDEVLAMLDGLAASGWPSFGALVMLLASCRPTWRENAERLLNTAKDLAGEAAQREPTVLRWFGRAIRIPRTIFETRSTARV